MKILLIFIWWIVFGILLFTGNEAWAVVWLICLIIVLAAYGLGRLIEKL